VWSMYWNGPRKTSNLGCERVAAFGFYLNYFSNELAHECIKRVLRSEQMPFTYVLIVVEHVQYKQVTQTK